MPQRSPVTSSSRTTPASARSTKCINSATSAKRETHAYGLNKVGLERRGFDRERLRAIQHAYRLLLAAKMNTTQAVEKLKEEGIATEDVAYLIEFIESSERGVLK